MKDETETKLEALNRLREPFAEKYISKLPKPTRAQTDEVKKNFKAGIRCKLCGGWHHKNVVHLDYVGHAALTDRLLDVDPFWNWEPLSVDDHGFPRLDKDNGMWIKLTVCGVTRMGFGDAQGKNGPNATKELIGDALRNAAMRFGAALDLWHKGDLHDTEEEDGEKEEKRQPQIVNVKKRSSGDWELIFDQAFVNPRSRTPEAVVRWRAKNSKEIIATIANDMEANKLKGFLTDMEALYGEGEVQDSKLRVNI